MNKHIVTALYQKEMTDILRDKKTILMMIIVPLLLYPLLFIFSMWITSTALTSNTRDTFTIAFENIKNQDELIEAFNTYGREYDYNFAYLENLHSDPDTDKESFLNELENGSIAAYLKVNPENSKEYIIVYNSSNTASSTAAAMIEDMLMEIRNEKRVLILEDMGLEAESVLEPIQYTREDHATSEETVGALFGSIIPFLLVTSILMGAMYPAIDCTAGEKERGTLETLLTLPVHNLELITSKFLATSTVAVAAAFLNVLSMGILGGYFFSSMQASSETVLEFDISVYIPAILIMLVLAVVLALFASAVCLCVCIFARSFKEAQNYSTPVMLVFMFAAMVCIIPNIDLAHGLEFLPVVNVVLLISELFQFEFNAAKIAIVLGSNLAYTIFAVLLMTKMFHSEEILFGESAGGIHLLEKRSQMKSKQIPGMGDVLLLMSVEIMIVLLAGSLLIVKLGIWGLVLQQLLMAACLFAYCYYIKTDFSKVFRFHKVNGWQLLGTVLCWFGTYVVMMLISAFLSKLFPASAESADSLLALWENQPLWLIILSSAFLPAVCEELLFRGYLFGSLSNKYRISTAIFWTGILFGLYHMNLIKLVVVGLLGAMLAYIVFKTDSIWCSILAHFLNNFIAVVISLYPEEIERKLPFLMQMDNAAGAILIALGILALIGGIWILKWRTGDFKKPADKQM